MRCVWASRDSETERGLQTDMNLVTLKWVTRSTKYNNILTLRKDCLQKVQFVVWKFYRKQHWSLNAKDCQISSNFFSPQLSWLDENFVAPYFEKVIHYCITNISARTSHSGKRHWLKSVFNVTGRAYIFITNFKQFVNLQDKFVTTSETRTKGGM